MKTKINIGTSKKNIVGVEVDKPFHELTYYDIEEIVTMYFGSSRGISIHGWCDVTEKEETIYRSFKTDG